MFSFQFICTYTHTHAYTHNTYIYTYSRRTFNSADFLCLIMNCIIRLPNSHSTSPVYTCTPHTPHILLTNTSLPTSQTLLTLHTTHTPYLTSHTHTHTPCTLHTRSPHPQLGSVGLLCVLSSGPLCVLFSWKVNPLRHSFMSRCLIIQYRIVHV